MQIQTKKRIWVPSLIFTIKSSNQFDMLKICWALNTFLQQIITPPPLVLSEISRFLSQRKMWYISLKPSSESKIFSVNHDSAMAIISNQLLYPSSPGDDFSFRHWVARGEASQCFVHVGSDLQPLTPENKLPSLARFFHRVRGAGADAIMPLEVYLNWFCGSKIRPPRPRATKSCDVLSFTLYIVWINKKNKVKNLIIKKPLSGYRTGYHCVKKRTLYDPATADFLFCYQTAPPFRREHRQGT